jgi:hypothetical protein
MIMHPRPPGAPECDAPERRFWHRAVLDWVKAHLLSEEARGGDRRDERAAAVYADEATELLVGYRFATSPLPVTTATRSSIASTSAPGASSPCEGLMDIALVRFEPRERRLRAEVPRASQEKVVLEQSRQ